MRTKTLICAAALLAAGVATSMAQSNVYSLNVVGYVNVPTTGGGFFNMIANPLNNANNSITNLFSSAQDNDQIYRWDVPSQNLSSTIYTYSAFLHAWDGNFTLNAGEGIFYLNSGSNATNTFVGDVIQGSYTNHIVGGGLFNAIGSSVPLGGSFTNSIVGLPLSDNDQVYTWDIPSQNLSGTLATYSQFLGVWDNTAITVNPGVGFFYLGSGANQTWVRNFTVQ
jgi:hypothetical protein